MSGIIEATNLQTANIKHTNGTTAVTIDGSGNAAFPQNATVTGNLSVSGTTTGISTMTLKTAVATTSGTEVDYTSIPSGTKRITVMFNEVSGTGSATADQLQVQLGTSSGLTTSGYVSRSDWGSGGIQVLTGFGVYGITGSSAISGIMTLVHMGSNVWVESHTARYNSSNGVWGGGRVALGGVCDRIRIRPIGSYSFDAGSVNVMYES